MSIEPQWGGYPRSSFESRFIGEERNVYSQGKSMPINQSPRNSLAKSEPSGFYNLATCVNIKGD